MNSSFSFFLSIFFIIFIRLVCVFVMGLTLRFGCMLYIVTHTHTRAHTYINWRTIHAITPGVTLYSQLRYGDAAYILFLHQNSISISKCMRHCHLKWMKRTHTHGNERPKNLQFLWFRLIQSRSHMIVGCWWFANTFNCRSHWKSITICAAWNESKRI